MSIKNMPAASVFAAALAGLSLPPQPRIALAVSGGGDSLALCLLFQEWAAEKSATLLALTVDHGLRPDSAAEALKVQDILRPLGIPHKILRWTGGKPESHLQERARAARYGLLTGACREEGFDYLAVAHNLEDQAETFWMRLAHGSGLDGLAGMAAARDLGGVTLIRPLLGLTRQQLRDVCAAACTEWIEDPSNANEKYLRVRLRQMEELLAAEGLTPQRLGDVLQKLGAARAALEAVTTALETQVVTYYGEGYAALHLAPLAAAPADIQRRLLSRLLQKIAPQDYPAGFDALEGLRDALAAPEFAGVTLAGAEVAPAGAGAVFFLREAAALPPAAPLREGLVWDRRFRFTGYPPESLEVRPLGDTGLAALRKKLAASSPPAAHLARLPHKLRRQLPALFEGENLVAVPHLSWIAPEAAARLSGGRMVPVTGA